MEDQLKFAFIGRNKTAAAQAAFRLRWTHHFRVKYLMDGVTKFVRYMYKYNKYERKMTWEERIKIYDALYAIDPNIHINYLLRRLSDATASVVVQDCRYINEVESLRDAGFTIIRFVPTKLLRPRIVENENTRTGLVSIHESFGRADQKLKVDHSILYSDRQSVYHGIDNIIEELKKT